MGSEWVREALSDISVRYSEIKSVVLDDNNAAPRAGDDSQWSEVTRETLNLQPFNGGQARLLPAGQPLWFDLHPEHQQSHCIKGTPGNFSLMIDGRHFYIKGVAYNPGQDWRDANVPLSAAQVNHDFSVIESLGGNTIRRYGRTWSDRNIFNAAVNHRLKVMYGFWFMQDEDFLTNTAKQREYEEQIDATVRTYRDHPGLLGWSLGNEVWGLLKHKYSQPYLTDVRHSYVLFVDRMAQKIRKLDPNHPIFAAQEAKGIAGAVNDFRVGAPTLDVLTVNAYYEPDISGVSKVFAKMDPSRPYVVSEFGPDGYWDADRNQYDSQKGLLEPTATTKAWYYANRWRQDIQAHAGQNVGGVAYCWSDRYEGTATWFGMVDLDGREKPVCDALRAAWQHPDPGLMGQYAFQGPRILEVSYPKDAQWAGEPFIVKANVQYSRVDRPKFLWSVTGPNFQPDVARVTPLGGGEMASIELPGVPGWYRVQLKVVGRGGLDEANVPVMLRSAGDRDANGLTMTSLKGFGRL
jgi:cellulose synthase (UDP-forming)